MNISIITFYRERNKTSRKNQTGFCEHENGRSKKPWIIAI